MVSAMRNAAVFLFVVVLLAVTARAEAHEVKKVYQIGYLSAATPARESARSEAIRLALREVGYIEGQNIAFEYRYAEGKQDRYSALVAELVRLKVDIILVVGGTPLTVAAKTATKTIPIVMMGGGIDPVAAGLVESLARPGGNVTALTILNRELGGAAGAAQRSCSQSCPCLGFLRSGRSGQCTRRERSYSGRGAHAKVDDSILGGTR
jgi:ABC-type uncharacterized transport system substrate-binding protein